MAELPQGVSQFCSCTQSPLLWGTAAVTSSPLLAEGHVFSAGSLLTGQSPEQLAHTDPVLDRGPETSRGDCQPTLQVRDLRSLTLPPASEVNARAGVRGRRRATAPACFG